MLLFSSFQSSLASLLHSRGSSLLSPLLLCVLFGLWRDFVTSRIGTGIDVDIDMSDPEGDGAEAPATSLAATRSRRGPSRTKGKRAEGFAKLKAGARYTVEEELANPVYEMVDEKTYAERVQERQEDAFIVDDDDGDYVEHGREIFDEDEEDAAGPKHAGPRKAAKDKKKEEEKARKNRGNIRNMMLNMRGKKGERAADGKDKLEGDAVLASLLGEIKSTSSSTKPTVLKKKVVAPEAAHRAAAPAAPASNPFARPKATGIPEGQGGDDDDDADDAELGGLARDPRRRRRVCHRDAGRTDDGGGGGKRRR